MAYKQAGWSPFTKTKDWDIKGYLKGEQGWVPDYKGKPTRQALNESKVFNPPSADEHIADMSDSRIHTDLMQRRMDVDMGRSDEKFSKADDDYLKHYKDKSKKKRPNRKDRY
tara:strand:- start:95 stop:430 length:336 start_codon:yes stop_codon:yes gene_type:complete